MFSARDVTDRPVIARVWFHMDGTEQLFLARVMRVRHERYCHPGLDRFVLPADVPRGSPCPVAKEEGRCYRQTESCQQKQRSRLDPGHDITIERHSPLTLVDYPQLPSGMPFMLTFYGLSHAFN